MALSLYYYHSITTRTTGAIGAPMAVRLLERGGTGAVWRLVYGSRLFSPDLKEDAVGMVAKLSWM